MRMMPTITKNLLIINLLIFLATYVVGGIPVGDQIDYKLNDIFGLYYFGSDNFHVYQLLTYMFMHGSLLHVLMNMFMLWMFGSVIEQALGAKRFLFYYIFCGVGAGLIQEAVQFIGLASPFSSTVGASGAVYSLLLAFAMMFPEQKMFIIPIPVPIKAKWMVLGSIFLELFSEFGASGDGVAHMAHLGGMLFGFLLIRYWKSHPDVYDGTKGRQIFNNMQTRWNQHKNKSEKPADSNGPSANDKRQQDWDFNARRKDQQDEIDRILDKIRKSGYDSLTQEEKQKLFDQSRNQ